ncbi:hypothetical protein PLICRDRAFT_109828 [Plicaturopsis crispa FD-325 SS-3]|nr:hypothetical protein PLICRDRAFT_109828 [Plicaturopsis crispa FD-325 SS-3]
MKADTVDHFAEGAHYGVVLTPQQVAAVEATLQLNPILEPPTEDGSKDHLLWDMLFDSGPHCKLASQKASHRAWMAGRKAPATFPRTTRISLVTEGLLREIVVSARDAAVGVTCGEVIDKIDEVLHKAAPKEMYSRLPKSGSSRRLTQDNVLAAHAYNRSTAPDVPGGRLEQYLMWADFLLRRTVFGGIAVNRRYLEDCFNVEMPCTFELRRLDRNTHGSDVHDDPDDSDDSELTESSDGVPSRASSMGRSARSARSAAGSRAGSHM